MAKFVFSTATRVVLVCASHDRAEAARTVRAASPRRGYRRSAVYLGNRTAPDNGSV